MTPQEAIQSMLENTHVLFTIEHGQKIAKAFGVELEPIVYQADGDKNPKGLTTNNGSKQAKGFACFDLAPMICNRLNLKYELKMGRGFQVRACCEALRLYNEFNQPNLTTST